MVQFVFFYKVLLHS